MFKLSRRFIASIPLHELLLQMPKDRAPLLKVLKASRKLKTNMTSGKYPAGIINLQVLGNGANLGPKCLYLFTDQARYLFNCGEGTQRLAHEHKMKLAKLEHVFLTNNSWGMTGGLAGVALTIQDIGIPEITIHGPRGLGSLFVGTRRFVILKDLEIKVVNGDQGGHFEDHVLKIEYVPIVKPSTPTGIFKEEEEEDDVDYYGNYRGLKGTKMVTVEESDIGSGGIEACICYICEPKKKEGSLLIDKCIERGVPPGPLLGKLKAGQDITLPNGSVVKASEVRTPDCPGPKFLVVDCLDESYLPSLLSSTRLGRCQEEEIYLVVHFTPSCVLLTPMYQDWMSKFRLGTQHLILNDLCDGFGSEAVHRVQTKLGLIDEKIFPRLQELEMVQERILVGVPCVTFGQTLMKYCLRPGRDLDTTRVDLKFDEYVKETEENEEFQAELVAFKKRLSEGSEGSDYPLLTFLGTGSSIPNKTRNVSSILLRISEETSMLLDCGEGSTGQLSRFYGLNFESVLKTIKVVYISHLHADHHLGLVSLLLAKNEKIYLIAPLQISTWLNMFDVNFQKISHLYELVSITDFKSEYFEKKTPSGTLEALLKSLDCSEIQTDYVKHCPNAFGVSLKFNFGWKFTYSGDTMPCDNLVKIGLDSDLLVHEATMEDELCQEAKIKMHSTVSEAVAVGVKMRAKFTLLTHFSQRYAKVPLINSNFNNVGVAFDNMVIRVNKDLGKVGNMYSVLKALFSDDCDELQVKSAKRRRKKELVNST